MHSLTEYIATKPSQWRPFRSESSPVSLALYITLPLYLSLSLFLYICFCSNISLSISLLLFFCPLSLSPSLSCWPDCCRALTEKKHSEIWHCIIMPQTCTYHSLAASLLSSLVLKVWLSILVGLLTLRQLMSEVCSLSLPCENHRDSCSSPSNHRGLRLKGKKCEMWSCTLCLVCTQYCAVLGNFALQQHWFMHPCEGDSASLGLLLSALSPVYLMASPHCWSIPTSGRCTYSHQRTNVPKSP